ncbi:hypothetical protein, partial [Neisseria sp. P0017.S003]|uniref:hypothetical protein n=1 Tax=Neisseria sp. P0017.S003 TaxID=3436779 RepID=UPI003F7D2E35
PLGHPAPPTARLAPRKSQHGAAGLRGLPDFSRWGGEAHLLDMKRVVLHQDRGIFLYNKNFLFII